MGIRFRLMLRLSLRSSLYHFRVTRSFSSGASRLNHSLGGLDDSKAYAVTVDRSHPTTLPEQLVLPPAPPYPCPHLETFHSLAPLYDRQWRVLPSPVSKTLSLKKLFHFRTIGGTVRFFNLVMSNKNGICLEEQHHPSSLLSTTNSVLITLCTHEARLPGMHTTQPLELKPGLTLRDVRLAMLIEKMYYEKFLSEGGTGKFVPMTDGNLHQPLTMEDVVWKGSRLVFEDDVFEERNRWD